MEIVSSSNDAVTVLIVEDDPAMLVALRDILEGAGYNVSTAANGKKALEAIGKGPPSLILSDIGMPVMDGIQLFEEVRKLPIGTAIPFIFLTARGTREDIFAGKSLGADDYITKPITSHELLSAVRARLQRANELMVTQLKSAYKASLRALANAIEARDRYTRGHVERVNAFAQCLATDLDWDIERKDSLEFGAILHDIGKISVGEAILTKPGPLDEQEWNDMRKHPVVGARMIQDIPYLASAVPMVLYHHERWDGSGYPQGLKAESIPEEARLLAVVDAFDAMTSDRPYRSALPLETTHELIHQESGKQFDPTMVKAFSSAWDRGEIQNIFHKSKDRRAESL
ncbi:MAG: response regulator [Anaerolineales bacterium]|jgi:putative two-component system response regulator